MADFDKVIVWCCLLHKQVWSKLPPKHFDFQHRSQHRQQSTAQPCAHKYHKYPQSEQSEAWILSWNQNCCSAAMEDETQTRRTTTWDDEVSEKPNIPLVWQKETSGCIKRSSQSKEVSSPEKKNTISICECHKFNCSLGWFNIICSYIFAFLPNCCIVVLLCYIMLLYVSWAVLRRLIPAGHSRRTLAVLRRREAGKYAA